MNTTNRFGCTRTGTEDDKTREKEIWRQFETEVVGAFYERTRVGVMTRESKRLK